MQILIFSMTFVTFSLSVFLSVTYGKNKEWTGTIIDAHSQYGCKTDVEDIIYAIQNFRVNKTLFSARGGCYKKETPIESQMRILNLVRDLNGKGGFLISTKIGGLRHSGIENEKAGLKWLSINDKEFHKQAVGFGEIVVQHADHFHEELTVDGIQSDLESFRIQRAISIILKRKKPVILHLELNDSEDSSVKILYQLKRLLKKNPDRKFILIHMAQATVSEARSLIEDFSNIYFLTSRTNALQVIGRIKKKRRGDVTQFGWINFFNSPQENAPYKGWFKEYLSSMMWKIKWRKLLERYPDRFIFAMDNVFNKHWKAKRYKREIRIWRKAFSLLPREIAMKIACENANKMWKLNVVCLAKQN
tara:strand:- start:3469 stop:4551 length:1083 start_codon:yes stop_codon:yes gene_type:complete